jgi:hypothetical protein
MRLISFSRRIAGLSLLQTTSLLSSPNELPYLGWFDPTTDNWENAVLGNYGSSNDTFVGDEAWNGDMTLGDYGVNTPNDTVWAVVDQNSDFAVAPEPPSVVSDLVALFEALSKRRA